MEEQKGESEPLEISNLSPIQEKMEDFLASIVLDKTKLEEQVIEIDENCPIFQILKNKVDFPGERNIILIGAFGHGKSSLINWAFGKEICKTGSDMETVTIIPKKITAKTKDFSISLIDTPGIEPGSNFE